MAGRVRPLENHRRYVVEPGMPTVRFVPGFDEVKHRETGIEELPRALLNFAERGGATLWVRSLRPFGVSAERPPLGDSEIPAPSFRSFVSDPRPWSTRRIGSTTCAGSCRGPRCVLAQGRRNAGSSRCPLLRRKRAAAPVKADVSCPEITEVRCLLVTDVRVP